jgi:hypothetical protein
MLCNRVALWAAMTQAACDHAGANLATEEMIATLSVDVTAGVMKVDADFDDVRSTSPIALPVQLDTDDSVTVTFRGVVTDLVEVESDVPDASGMIVKVYSYKAMIDVDPTIDEAEPLVVDLHRGSYTSATVTTATPATIALTPLPASASRAADLVLTWTPANTHPVEWVAYTTDACAMTVGNFADEPQTGSLTIPANTLAVPTPSATCPATLRMLRVADLMLEAPFSQGGIDVRVETYATFVSTP